MSDLSTALVDVTFSTGVFTNPNGTGRLIETDLAISDPAAPGITVLGVSHEAGRTTATLVLSTGARPGFTTLVARTNEIFDSQGRPVTESPVVVGGPP